MTKIILDAALRARLHDLTREVEFCDESGRTLGYFVPTDDYLRWAYGWARTQFTDEELGQARDEPGGRTTAEVLGRLTQA